MDESLVKLREGFTESSEITKSERRCRHAKQCKSFRQGSGLLFVDLDRSPGPLNAP